MMQQCWQNHTCMTASRHMLFQPLDRLCVFTLRVHLQAPFRHQVLAPQMEAYNHHMSAVQSSVEWLFGDIVSYFKFLDFKKNFKIGLSQEGKCILFVQFCIMH